MEILFASGHLPAAQGRQAGARHSFHICRHLSTRHRVHLLAFATASELEHIDRRDMALYASWEVVPIERVDRTLGALSGLHLPLTVSARKSARYRERLCQIVKEASVDAVILDHTGMFQYATDIPERVARVGSAHDIMTQAWLRRAAGAKNRVTRVLLGAEASRMRRWEARALTSVDLTLVLSGKDRNMIEQLQPAARAVVIDLWVSQIDCADRGRHRSKNLVFWGALDRMENIDAVRWATREILPIVRRSVPDVKLYIAGNRGECLAPEFAGRDDVVITGYVADVSELMSRMDVALVPLRFGAGVKAKTLECMSAGLPVVTTSVGAEGIDEGSCAGLLVSDSAEEIAAKAVALLSNPEEARDRGMLAAEFVRRNHNFAARMTLAEKAITDAVERRCSRELVGRNYLWK